MSRQVFFISDRTGITAETLGGSLLTQFPNIEFIRTNIPFVTSEHAARSAAEQITKVMDTSPEPPLVFSTLTDPRARKIIAASSPLVFDLFGTFVENLEKALHCESSHTPGQMHGISDSGSYENRLHALNYTLGHDDGLNPRDLSKADIVLLGVSRCGKTPTCLYLAMHYSLRAANYPLTEDDFGKFQLSELLGRIRGKLYGLTIVPEQLSHIRRERRPNGTYSHLEQCRYEIERAEKLFLTEKIPYMDTTTVSIEEIAATIVRDKRLRQ